MMEKAEDELAKEEADDDEAQYLVGGTKAP